MSTIAAGTTSGTALVSTGDTSGTLQLQVNGTTPAVTLNTSGAVGVGSTPGYGTSGQVLTSAGAGAAPTWTTPSAGALTLLATVTPTAAANVDFLNTFTSSYDNYLVIVDDIAPDTASNLVTMRFASGGVIDTGSNYYRATFNSTASTAAAQFDLSNSYQSSDSSFNGHFSILNANSASSIKSMVGFSMFQQTAGTNSFGTLAANYFFPVNSTISGFRLFFGAGANFLAKGKVRVYGYNNS